MLPAFEMTYSVLGGALNSTHALRWCCLQMGSVCKRVGSFFGRNYITWRFCVTAVDGGRSSDRRHSSNWCCRYICYWSVTAEEVDCEGLCSWWRRNADTI